MAKKTKIDIELNAKGGPTLKKTTEETKKQTRALDERTKASKRSRKADEARYSQEKQGIIQTAPAAKNFSKMSRAMDGGTGAGGLVRAYALLAANVFALSAAFGVLSRAAQVDTLMESMRVLEVTTGAAVGAVGRELQRVTGYGMDLAESMRATSLALSAGFDSSSITELGEVARNAAVSLGRPMGDALDRIFRGVIKVEPELLDEIGLFVRVKDASARYASTLGIAASELTEFQKRQAFAAEAVRQGKEKFDDFAEVDTDQFSRLAAAFSDVAQKALTLVNWAIKPMVDLFASSGPAIALLFTGIVGILGSKAIPAMGAFSVSAKQAAKDAIESNEKYQKDLNIGANNQRTKAYEMVDAEKDKTRRLLAESRKQRKAMGGDYAGQAKPADKDSRLGRANLRLQTKGLKNEAKITALQEKQKALASSRRGTTAAAVKNAIAGLEREIELERDMLRLTEKRAKIKGDFPDIKPGEGSLAESRGQKLARNQLFATGVQNIASQGEFGGVGAAFKELKKEWKALPDLAEKGKIPLSGFQKGLFGLKGAGTVAAIGIQQVGTAVQAAMGWIMLIVPALTFFVKYMGIGNKEHKAWQEANQKSLEVLDLLSEKVDKQSDILRNYGESITKANQAASAFAKTMATSSQAVVDSMKAWEEFQETGTGLAIFWEKTKQFMAGGSVEDQQRSLLQETLGSIDVAEKQVQAIFETYGNLDALINNLEEGKTVAGMQKDLTELNLLNKEFHWNWNSTAATEILDEKQMARIKEFGIDLNGMNSKQAQQAIIALSNEWRLQIKNGITPAQEGINEISDIIMDLGEEGIAGFFGDLNEKNKGLNESASNLDAIAESAKDVARTYADLFVSKTDVDKPLAIFTDLAKEIGKEDTDKRLKSLMAIKTEKGAIWSLMTQESREQYEQAEKEEEFLAILKTVEDSYIDMQANITVIKNIQKQLTEESKHWKSVVGKAGEVSAIMVTNDIRKLKLAQQLKKEETDRLFDIKEKTRKQIEGLNLANLDLSTAKKRKEIADKLGMSTKEVADLQSHMIQESINQTAIDIKLKTKEFEVAKQINTVLKQRIAAQEKLNKVRLKALELDKKQQNFARTGSSTLNVQQETEMILEAEKTRLKLAEEKAKVEKAVIDAQYGIIEATLAVMTPLIHEYNEMVKNAKEGDTAFGMEQINVDTLISDIQSAKQVLKDTIDEASTNAGAEFARTYIDSLIKGLKSKFTTEIKSFTDPGGTFSNMMSVGNVVRDLNMAEDPMSDSRYSKAVEDMESDNEEIKKAGEEMKNTLDSVIKSVKANEFALKMSVMKHHLLDFANAIKEFGPEGVLAATFAEFTVGMIDAFANLSLQIKGSTEETIAKLAVAAYAIQGVAAIASAAGKQKISAIDQEINAEKRRDGKSKESLARLKALEVEKEKVAKKNFDVQKKLAMANVIMSTAMAVMQVWTNPADWFKTWAGMMTPLILGLGAAQLAIISGTSYQGGGSIGGAAPAAKDISVGKRGNKVDVSKGAGAGELGYLSGQRGVGTNANNFVPMGGAAGLRKGYASGGYIVGERGPEMMYPDSGFNVTPNDELGGGSVNANFTINAIDAAGVEEVLMAQQSNIISMIRTAANDNGEEFLESVNTDHMAGQGGGG